MISYRFLLLIPTKLKDYCNSLFKPAAGQLAPGQYQEKDIDKMFPLSFTIWQLSPHVVEVLINLLYLKPYLALTGDSFRYHSATTCITSTARTYVI